jgi:uncharacterized protein DUF4154
MLAFAMPLPAAQPYREDAVKAAFISRFTGYVEWPATTFKGGEFLIAVLGAPQIADELQRLVADRPVKNLPTRVRKITTAVEAREAQMLYVGPQYSGNLETLTKDLGPRPVLIVADHPRGLDEGSIINLLLVDQRVRFEVSLLAAERAGLKLSSELLSVAVRVRGAKDQGMKP